MDRQVNGVVSGHESCSVTSTHASNAVAKAQPSITSFPVWPVVVMTNGIFSVYAQHAIIRREGGFLVHLLHP
jgi:hypothetical protein